jgi:hypothetical protein
MENKIFIFAEKFRNMNYIKGHIHNNLLKG